MAGSKVWVGSLKTSFLLLGGLHVSIILEGYPPTGETNAFLEAREGKRVRMTIEELE